MLRRWLESIMKRLLVRLVAWKRNGWRVTFQVEEICISDISRNVSSIRIGNPPNVYICYSSTGSLLNSVWLSLSQDWGKGRRWLSFILNALSDQWTVMYCTRARLTEWYSSELIPSWSIQLFPADINYPKYLAQCTLGSFLTLSTEIMCI